MYTRPKVLGKWCLEFDRGFKGLKQAIKLEFNLGRYDKVEV